MSSKKRGNGKTEAQRQAEAEAQARAQQRLYESYANQTKKQRKQKTTFYTLLLVGGALILFSVLSKYGLMTYAYERYYTVLGYCCVIFAIGYQFLYVNPFWKKDGKSKPVSNKSYSNLSKKEQKHLNERALEAQEKKKK